MKRGQRRVTWNGKGIGDNAKDKAALGQMRGWRSETVDGKPALVSPAGQEPPPLVLKCPFRGAYAITFHLSGLPNVVAGTLRVECADAPAPLTVTLRGEFYIGVWRLRGAPIVIRKVNLGHVAIVGITFEKYGGEIPFFSESRVGKEPTVWGICDQNDLNVEVMSSDVEHVAPIVRYHRELGFNVISWNMYAGTCEFPTRIGTTTPRIDIDNKEHIRLLAEHKRGPSWDMIWREFPNRYDGMKEGIRLAHGAGLKFFPCLRMNNEWFAEWAREYGHEDFLKTFWCPEFFKKHPEYWSQYKSGVHTGGGMDYSHAAVRKYRLGIVREVMENYPEIDGIFLDLHRHPPMVSYPDKVVNAFKKKYGIDVRRVKPINEETMDPRWHKFRARWFTEFMRSVKKAKQALGRRYPTVVRTAKTFADALREGPDLQVWFEEHLADVLILEDHRGESYDTSLAPVIEAAAKAGVKVLGGFQNPAYVENTPWKDVQKVAERWLADGARGVAFYESNQLVCGSQLRRHLPQWVKTL